MHAELKKKHETKNKQHVLFWIK